MKIHKKLLITVLLISVLFIANVSSKAYAVMSPTFEHEARYSRGVSNVCYVVSSSASRYTSYINSAANGWVHTHYGDNPIYMTAVSSTVGSHMDIYAKSLSGKYENYYAYTNFWDYNANKMNPNGTENYWYTEITLNTNLTQSTWVLTHEMGHCFGLADNQNKDSIMYYCDLGNAKTVQACDNETINYLY